MLGVGVVAGLGLITIAAIMAWKRSQGRAFFEGGGTLPEPGKYDPNSTWSPTYGEEFRGDATNPANPTHARHIVHTGRLVRGYDPPHMGIDISAPIGTPVFAAKSGTVVFSGRAPGYGIAVGISHGPRESTWYAHLNQSVVAVGARVQGGQVIGEVGRTTEGPEALTTAWGKRMGSHLHFEVHPAAEPYWQAARRGRTDPAVWTRRQGIDFFGSRW